MDDFKIAKQRIEGAQLTGWLALGCSLAYILIHGVASLFGHRWTNDGLIFAAVIAAGSPVFLLMVFIIKRVVLGHLQARQERSSLD